jgi:hypothetical protein
MLLASTLSAFLGSVAFVWIAVAVLFVVLFFAAANDSLSVAFWATVIGLGILQLLSSLDPFTYVKENPKDVLFVALGYFPAGIAWSFYRWWRVLKKAGSDLASMKSHFSNADEWKRHVDRMWPTASQNKSRISVWITYWPFSLASYILCDFLYEIADWIYTKISGLYQRVSDHVKASLLKG